MLACACLIYWRSVSRGRGKFSVRIALGTFPVSAETSPDRCRISRTRSQRAEAAARCLRYWGTPIGFRAAALYFRAIELVLRRTASSMRTSLPRTIPELGSDRTLRPPPPPLAGARATAARLTIGSNVVPVFGGQVLSLSFPLLLRHFD